MKYPTSLSIEILFFERTVFLFRLRITFQLEIKFQSKPIKESFLVTDPVFAFSRFFLDFVRSFLDNWRKERNYPFNDNYIKKFKRFIN